MHKPTFKFHLIPHNLYKGEYQHETVVLAEGFSDLGLKFYGTCNYWKEYDTNEYLIKICRSDFIADINIYNQYYFIFYPEEVSKINYNSINILIDIEDGLYSAYCDKIYNNFDLILKTHFNKHINYSYYHPNIKPWIFGISKRMISASNAYSTNKISKDVFINYRINHDLRGIAEKELTPILSKCYNILQWTSNPQESNLKNEDYLNWVQTNHRHDPQYYKKLNTSLITFAFGGHLTIKPFATNRINRQLQIAYLLKSKILNALNKRDLSCYFIYQYDSWRLWESFLSNTCPIHMDFYEQKWVFPIMPENGKHYLGVKNNDFKSFANDLNKLDIELISNIGTEGRKWALENYSPKSLAKHLLNIIENL